jgi:hypothetical protein
MTVKNQNYIHGDIKSRLNLMNSCYHSIQNHLFSLLLSKNISIIIYETVILPIVLYRCETWYVAQREEHRLRVFENRLLKRIFEPKRE